MTNRRKTVLAAVLVLIMAASAIGGTVAWFSATASLENTFVVGAFTPPTKPNPNPDKPNPGPDPGPGPVDPDHPDPADPDPVIPTGNINSFIYEPYWKSNENLSWNGGKGDRHRLVPGKATAKDPYIGIGPSSEAGYIYVYIKNELPANTVYFKLNDNWAPVTRNVTQLAAGIEDSGIWYTGGLFKYVNNDGTLLALDPSRAAETGSVSAAGDVWTKHPVFTTVKTSNKSGALTLLQDSNSLKMVVYAYIYQQSDGTNDSSGTVEDAAIAWAERLGNTPSP